MTAINSAGLTISASLSGSTITLTDSGNAPITISDLQVEGITKAGKTLNLILHLTQLMAAAIL